MESFEITLNGRFTREDKARRDYVYLPFDLPFAARRLNVRYSYSAAMTADKVEGGNVIDIGLFDPRGSEFPGGAGFRGWTGSARSEFFITEEQATPGYLPGPLPPGRYQVILGFYRVWEQGADYTVEISADPAPASAGANPAAVQPTPVLSAARPAESIRYRKPGGVPPPVWLKGDLQSHTYHSDGKGSPEQLVAKARALGLDFLAVTDHNGISHHAKLAELADASLLLIPGQEVTTFYGHMNVWGARRWCDFRAATARDMAAIIDFAHGAGGVCSINHPKTGGPPWEYGADLDVQTMEVWQGPWPYRNTESLALWDRLLNEGRRLPAVGGSDYHCPAGEETSLLRLGQPTTWVHAAERSEEAILAAIVAGRCCISAHPRGPRLDFVAQRGGDRARMGGVLRAARGEPITLTIDVQDAAGYRLRVVADSAVVHETPVESNQARVELPVSAARYVRCEIVGDTDKDRLPDWAPPDIDRRDWRRALSNPVFVAPE